MYSWVKKRGLKEGDIVSVPIFFKDKKYRVNRFLDNKNRVELVNIEDNKGWFITDTYNVYKEEEE